MSLGIANVQPKTDNMTPTATRLLTWLQTEADPTLLYRQADVAAALGVTTTAVNDCWRKCPRCADWTMKVSNPKATGCRTDERLWGLPKNIAEAQQKGW